jgi:hypothetical protein
MTTILTTKFSGIPREGPQQWGNPLPERFVLNFNLFPQNEHVFKCDGLYRAYWQSPPQFRERVVESFRKLSSGVFAQYVDLGVWACLQNPPSLENAAQLNIGTT